MGVQQVAGDPIEAAALKAIKWEILERPGQPTDCRPLVRTTTTTRHYDSLFYTSHTSRSYSLKVQTHTQSLSSLDTPLPLT